MNMAKIIPPTNCPCCNSELEWNNNQLFCTNSLCDAKSARKLQHFASVMKIKGLGPATIKKLKLENITDLYSLSEDEISFLLSSDKLGSKLFDEIENSKKAPLNLLLPAFSIPLVGKTASEKLSTVCESIYDITDDTCRRAGLGPKCTNNLLSWIEKEFPLVKDLPFDFKFKRVQTKAESKGVVCISGKLKSFKCKGSAKLVLEAKGYKVVDNFTREVTILINESGIESAKTKKARKAGVTIVTNIIDFIGE